MMDDWAFRIRNWRRRAGLSQEVAAGMFMVDVRTVRRWETGKTQPPLDVRQRLQRTNVPLIKRPEYNALAEVVRSSTLGTMLLDENLTVLAMSEREHQFWQRQFGIELTGQSWEPFIPPYFQTLFAEHGGWRTAIKAGASSLTGDFRIPLPGTDTMTDGAHMYAGRVQYTILRMSDNTLIHNYVARTLPDDAVLQPARLTFLDEIHMEE